MKTFIAVLFGMVLWHTILSVLAARYKTKLGEMKNGMVKFKSGQDTAYFDVEEVEITLADGYEVVTEGNKVMIRKKEGKE